MFIEAITSFWTPFIFLMETINTQFTGSVSSGRQVERVGHHKVSVVNVWAVHCIYGYSLTSAFCVVDQLVSDPETVPS